MFCNKCGSQLTENDQFCKNCGATVNAQEEKKEEVAPAVENTAVPTIVESQPAPSVFEGSTGSTTVEPKPEPVVESKPADSINADNIFAQSQSQPAAATNTVQQPKSSSNAKFVVIGIVAVLAFFAGFKLFAGNSGGNNGGNNGGGTVTPVSKSTYKVNFKGITFSIPDDLIYEDKGTYLAIGDEDGTWVSYFEVEKGSFNNIKANKSGLAGAAKKDGYDCKSAEVKELEGVEYVTLECAKAGNSRIFAFAKVNSMYWLYLDILNKDFDIDYSVFKHVSPIVKDLKVADETKTNMSTDDVSSASIFEEYAK